MADELKYPLIRQAICSTAWAIRPDKLAEILAIVALRAHGERLSDDEIRERIGAARERPKLRANGDIAVLPLVGTIAHRMGSMAASSGGTSVEAFTRDFRALLNDPSVAAIVLDVESPGGAVDGVQELADEIYQARGIKPISAVANTYAASAAYWIATAADELAVTPSGEVGSIGVVAAHQDMSAFQEQMGVKTTLISAGKYKVEGNPYEPLTEEAQAAIQARVDDAYGQFVRAVARRRGVPLDTVRAGFGQGRMVNARDAVKQGMADRVATLDDVIATIGRRRATPISGAAYQPPAALTFEGESETVLSTVRAFQQRVEALSALRAQRNQSPLAEANVARLAEHRAALIAVADAYSELLAALAPAPHADLSALLVEHLAIEARRHGVQLTGA